VNGCPGAGPVPPSTAGEALTAVGSRLYYATG